MMSMHTGQTKRPIVHLSCRHRLRIMLILVTLQSTQNISVMHESLYQPAFR